MAENKRSERTGRKGANAEVGVVATPRAGVINEEMAITAIKMHISNIKEIRKSKDGPRLHSARAKFINAVRKYAPLDTVPLLVAELNTEDLYCKGIFANALGEMEGKAVAAIPALAGQIEYLLSRRYGYRKLPMSESEQALNETIDALGKIRDTRALPILTCIALSPLSWSQSQRDIGYACIRALSGMSDRLAGTEVKDALSVIERAKKVRNREHQCMRYESVTAAMSELRRCIAELLAVCRQTGAVDCQIEPRETQSATEKRTVVLTWGELERTRKDLEALNEIVRPDSIEGLSQLIKILTGQ